jgi:hypothetical protein
MAIICGIDPGTGKRRCGIALVSGGKLFRHKTVDGCSAVEYLRSLHSVYRFKRCTVEMPQAGIVYAKHSTKKNAVMLEAGRIKLAMNIGQNIQLAKDIIAELKRLGVKVKEVRPQRKATKWQVGYWCQIFGWEKSDGRPPSEHARDASVHALQYENWVGWNV